jgi:hypothetical protein
MSRHWGHILPAALAACLALSAAAIAEPQQAARLTRPADAIGPGGKVANPDATIGNMTVETYADAGRRVAAADSEPKRIGTIEGLKFFICDMDGLGAITADAVKAVVKPMTKDERARLKARDAASLTSFSVAVLARLDGITADAIRADEAIGPGVYHDAIAGLTIGLDACKFYGVRP